MRDFHQTVGIASVAALGGLSLWAFAAALIRRAPGRWFGTAANVVHGVLIAQGLAGLLLLLIGPVRPPLHSLYGFLALGTLAGGMGVTRRLGRDRWVPLAWVAFFAFALALRALTTGLR